MKLSKTKHFVYITMLAAMAIAINLLETMLTVSLPFGMRLGLANIIALITIEILGVKEMIIVNTMRVVIWQSAAGNDLRLDFLDLRRRRYPQLDRADYFQKRTEDVDDFDVDAVRDRPQRRTGCDRHGAV